MQTSKKKKRILMLVLVWAFFTVAVILCKFLFTQPTMVPLTNYYVNTIDEKGENVDMVFIGGSRTYRTFDPDVFDKELGIKNTLNYGSPAQRTILSYYLLKEILDKYEPKYVVIGATYNGLSFEQTAHDIMFALDRLSFSNKIKCVIDCFGINKGMQALTGKVDYLSNMGPSTIVSTVKRKIAWSKGKVHAEESVTKVNGYKGEYFGIDKGNVSFKYGFVPSVFGPEEIVDKQFEYFDKMVQLCKEKKTKVYLVSGPCTMQNMFSKPGYQDAVNFYINYAKKNNIKYYNLNYLKNREETFSDDKFLDYLHANLEGGQYASKMLARIIRDNENGKDVSHYFYKNLDEVKKDVHRIPGCSCKVTDVDDKIVVSADSRRNDWVTPKYRLLATKDEIKSEEKTYVPITSWTKKNNWIFSKNDLQEYTEIRLEAKTGEAGEIIAYDLAKLSK